MFCILCFKQFNLKKKYFLIDGLQILCQDAYGQYLSNEHNMNVRISRSKMQKKLCFALNKLQNNQVDELGFLKILTNSN